MRLLFVCNEYPPAPHGGIGIFVKTLAHTLVELQHQVTVVGFSSGQDYQTVTDEAGVLIVRLQSAFRYVPHLAVGKYELDPAFLGERMYLSAKVAQVARQMGVDLVESYDWSGPLWWKPSVPLVVRLHGANSAYALYEHREPSRVLRLVERRNVAMADGLVAVSNHIGRLTLEALDLSPKSYTVIHNGVDIRVFRPIDVVKDPAEVLYVGTMSRRKGIFDLFRAIPAVVDQVPYATFTFAGRFPDGIDGERLLAELHSLLPEHMRRSVTILGHVPHDRLPELYSRTAVAVFPSRAEAFGLTCAEAMACGAAVVMTSHASGPEVIEDNISGLLVDPANNNDLSRAICSLLEQPELRARLGANAVHRARTMFDIVKLVEANVQFYDRVLNHESTLRRGETQRTTRVGSLHLHL